MTRIRWAIRSRVKGGAWGEVVLKVSEGIDATATAYLQNEIEILNSLNSPHYPKLFWNDVVAEDPRTGDPLKHRLFVTIEQRIAAEPLTTRMSDFRDEESARALTAAIVDAVTPLWLHPNPSQTFMTLIESIKTKYVAGETLTVAIHMNRETTTQLTPTTVLGLHGVSLWLFGLAGQNRGFLVRNPFGTPDEFQFDISRAPSSMTEW